MTIDLVVAIAAALVLFVGGALVGLFIATRRRRREDFEWRARAVHASLDITD